MEQKNSNHIYLLSKEITKQIFEETIQIIDSNFGSNYASKNPQLLSAIVKTHSCVYTSLIKQQS